MTVFDRGPATDPLVVEEWPDGVGWIAHPDEIGRRASHALRGDDGVWLIDPLDAAGIDERVASLGEVAGVAVCSNWHARDAGRIADRHGVAVHLPEWMGRIAERVAAPVERYAIEPGASGFTVRRWEPVPGWQEAILCRGGTVYVPETLGTAPAYTVGDERLGAPVVARPVASGAPLDDRDPDRVLVGHGAGVFEDAPAALRDALDHARRRVPRAVVENGPAQVRSLIAAALG